MYNLTRPKLNYIVVKVKILLVVKIFIFFIITLSRIVVIVSFSDITLNTH